MTATHKFPPLVVVSDKHPVGAGPQVDVQLQAVGHRAQVLAHPIAKVVDVGHGELDKVLRDLKVAVHQGGPDLAIVRPHELRHHRQGAEISPAAPVQHLLLLPRDFALGWKFLSFSDVKSCDLASDWLFTLVQPIRSEFAF